MAEPPLDDGVFQLRLICDEDTAVAVNPVGGNGALITETVLERPLATYMVFVDGFIATAGGSVPTDIVAVTVFVVPLITETVLERLLVTYMVLVDGFTATP